ncbi:MAG: hypothetical protein JST05_06795 [Acidobacteria bacterium]|nr:hypothetical protein [Acidobacteriota bacterium]
MPNPSRIALAALVLVAAGVATDRVMKACSDSSETVYVNTVHPDVNALASFANGELGLLQPTFARSYLVVAYRQMAGLGLSGADQQGALSLWGSRAGIGPNAPADRAGIWSAGSDAWEKARAQVLGQRPLSALRGDDYDAPPITDEAYGKATKELNAWMKSPGAQDPWVKAWVEGQDLVFSRQTDRALPDAAPAEAPAWFKQARAYQRAASLYYLRRTVEAAQAFAAIAADPAAPDRGLCAYLSVSCLAKGPDPRAALAACEKAQKDLLTKDHVPALEAMEDHLRFRCDPQGYLRAVGVKLAGPLKDEDFQALLDNYTYAWDRLTDTDASKPPAVHLPDDPLTAWIQAFQSGDGAEAGYLAKPSLPWLVAALVNAKADGPNTPRLMADAAKVAPSSPAYLTLQYHLARLEMASGRRKEAAKRIASFTGKAVPISFANALRLLNRQADPDFPSLLKDMPLHAAGTEVDGGAEPPTPEQLLKPELRDEDKQVLQTLVPLDLLQTAALDPATPKEIGLPRLAFEKALWLGRVDTLQALEPAIPEEKALVDLMAQAQSPEERRFVLGLREGRIRNQRGYPSTPEGPQPIAALTLAQREQARTEQASIQALGDPVIYHCTNILAWAKAHPEDPRVPEALHQAVRLTRNYYSGAEDADAAAKQVSRLSAECFQMLHRVYPRDPWAAKTKYHF